MVKVASSLLSADFSMVEKWLPLLEEAEVDMVQWDIMDNKYVQNFGNRIEDIGFLRPKTRLFFDCHLMVQKPLDYLKQLQELGADSVTFHAETVKDPKKAIKEIKDFGFGVGISANNRVPVEKILPFVGLVDIALVMSVEAGFGGQGFISASLEKVSALRKLIDKERFSCEVQVDGGINPETGRQAVVAGADILVAGSYIFKSKDIKAAVLHLRQLNVFQ